MDYRGIILITGVLTLLACATGVVEYFRRRSHGIDPATLEACRSRIGAWWLLFGSLICALLLGATATVLFFGAVSFWALREYVTLTPTRPADHKTLVAVFFVLTPLQFFFVGADPQWFEKVFGIDPYFCFSALIPTLAFLIIPAAVAMTDDTNYYLERIAKLQVGLLICVYSLSFAPALLTMRLPDAEGNAIFEPTEIVAASGLEDHALDELNRAPLTDSPRRDPAEPATERDRNPLVESAQAVDALEVKEAPMTYDERPDDADSPHARFNVSNVTLLFVFVFLVQISDVAQYFWSVAFPRHKIAPRANSNRTWEGAALGALTASLFSVLLMYFTPFDHWVKAAFAGLVVAIMGFAGNMTLSAIKRDQGVDDYGRLVDGHDGALDRVDSLCFAAPMFYHFVKLFCQN